MNFDTTIYLDYEDQVDITRVTLEDDILDYLDDEQSAGLDVGVRYNLVDCLLDAYYFYSTEEEYQEFTEEIGGKFVALRQKALKN